MDAPSTTSPQAQVRRGSTTAKGSKGWTMKRIGNKISSVFSEMGQMGGAMH